MARELIARRPVRGTIATARDLHLRRLAKRNKDESVRTVSTSNITLSGRQTINGVDVRPPNRVLVAGQTLGQNNGIYECRDYVWFRTLDAEHSDQLQAGTAVYVDEGTYAGRIWRLQTAGVVLGTTVQTWLVDDYATNTALAAETAARIAADSAEVTARTNADSAETAARIAADALLIPLTQRGANNGVATLDSGGKVPSGQLPSIAISDFLGSVGSQAAMLALTGQRGDWATRTDTNTTWILVTEGGGTLSDWRQLLTPTDAVLSVNSRTGAVTGLAEASDLTTETTNRTNADTTLQTNIDNEAAARIAGDAAANPWHQSIDPIRVPAFSTVGGSIAAWATYYQLLNLNDEVVFKVMLGAGTWKFSCWRTIYSSYGILTVTLNGTTIATLDNYSGTSVNPGQSVTSGIVVSASGVYELKLKTTGKNGSSSGYNQRLWSMDFTRTA